MSLNLTGEICTFIIVSGLPKRLTGKTNRHSDELWFTLTFSILIQHMGIWTKGVIKVLKVTSKWFFYAGIQKF